MTVTGTTPAEQGDMPATSDWHNHCGVDVCAATDDGHVAALVAHGHHNPDVALAAFQAHAAVLGWPDLAHGLPVTGDPAGMIRHGWARRLPVHGEPPVYAGLADGGRLQVGGGELALYPDVFQVTVLEAGTTPDQPEEAA